MSSTYKHWQAYSHSNDPKQFQDIRLKWQESPLPIVDEEHSLVKVSYSSLNYKDALALTGKGQILRALPLTPGIDLSGTIADTKSKSFKTNEAVIVTGCGLGELYNGAYGEYALVPNQHLVPLSVAQGLSLSSAMILGTAGFTAALAIEKIQSGVIEIDRNLPVLVTGASGGVGLLSLMMLEHLGYKTEAWTRSPEKAARLKELTSADVKVIDNDSLEPKALSSIKYAAAIDNIGGKTLNHVLSQTNLFGSVASIGLAQSAKFNSTVFPFILRGVDLLGVSSTNCPKDLRTKVWQQIGDMNLDWRRALNSEVKMNELPQKSVELIEGKGFGRSLVVV